jgi:hypothetical protein
VPRALIRKIVMLRAKAAAREAKKRAGAKPGRRALP